MAIGGLLTDGTPGETGIVDGYSYVYQLAAGATFQFNHVTLGQPLPVNFADYVYLADMIAERVTNTNTNGGQTQEFATGVWVVDQGGCYSQTNAAMKYWDLYDFAPGAQAAQNHGPRMVVFVGEGTVGIKGTADNRQFGLSVMAPKAHLVIDETVGYVDGCIVAKSVSMVGSMGGNGAGTQFHCNCYNGPLTCMDNKPPPPPCADILSPAACSRYVTQGKCTTDRNAMAGCKQTCGLCGGCPASGAHDPALSGSACHFPRMTSDCSLITQQDASVGSHSHYSGLCIGGRLTDSSPSQHGTVGYKSYVTDVGTALARFQWADGITTGQPLPFVWSEFEVLADSIQNLSSSVFVVIQGGRYDGPVVGTYSMDDFFGSRNGNHYNSASAAAANGANMLVVFKGYGTVRITAGAGGTPFMGTILAPRAKVILAGSSSYVDGVVIARSYIGERGMDQMHAYLYTGPMMCASSPPPPPVQCVNLQSDAFCLQKLQQQKCLKENVMRRCMKTCSAQCVGSSG